MHTHHGPHPRLGVSSWSLHNSLDRGDFSLLQLPALAAQRGIGRVEICHFHFPSTDDAYVKQLRAAFDDAGVEFYTMLVDFGDITHPDPSERAKQLAEMGRWIDVAGRCGAARARVIAGDAEPSIEALHISADGLNALAERGASQGVRVVVENWHRLLDEPAEVLQLLELTQGVGLKLDFGNWHGDRKYIDLPKIARFAECTHAKANFTAPGAIDVQDFTRCLDICRDAAFTGPHILIFDSPGDEWAGIEQERDIVLPYLN